MVVSQGGVSQSGKRGGGVVASVQSRYVRLVSVGKDRRSLRTTFDDAPELYDRTRPVPPNELFDDLATLTGLGAGARLVEIGCGTGQATLPLARRGFAVVAVELGAHLADYAREKLAGFPHAHVVKSSFEEWDPGGERFDAVVAFNSIHWVDPEVRYRKAAGLLRDQGALAVVAARYVTPENADPFWAEVEQDYLEVLGPREDSRPPPRPDEVSDLREEICAGYFRHLAARRYIWGVRFSAQDYVALLRTMSWHRRLEDAVRDRLFERIGARIDAQPGGSVTATLLATLNVAQRT